jgi:ABC-type oligopeptide transport system ATPase subunit
MSEPLLSIRSVSKIFRSGGREVRAVDNVSIEAQAGECLAIVGESGSARAPSPT